MHENSEHSIREELSSQVSLIKRELETIDQRRLESERDNDALKERVCNAFGNLFQLVQVQSTINQL